MKAKLEFDLPEEKEEHEDALKGSEWKWAMNDVVNYLRNETKHVDHTAEEYRILDVVWDKIIEVMQERDLRFY
jgi:hypothetical protein